MTTKTKTTTRNSSEPSQASCKDIPWTCCRLVHEPDYAGGGDAMLPQSHFGTPLGENPLWQWLVVVRRNKSNGRASLLSPSNSTRFNLVRLRWAFSYIFFVNQTSNLIPLTPFLRFVRGYEKLDYCRFKVLQLNVKSHVPRRILCRDWETMEEKNCSFLIDRKSTRLNSSHAR